MALYDNQHWLLSHIRDSFLATDDTGMCDMVILGEDIPKQLKKNGTLQCYPGMEESDDEDLDVMAESYDIQMEMPFSHRQRSNTAQRLEKMDIERKKAAKIKHVKWEHNLSSVTPTDQSDLFQRKDFRKKAPLKKGQSLLSEQLEKCPYLPPNPFKEYAKFDGDAQVSVPVRKYRIFMCMLPKEDRTYPLQAAVIVTARVLDFIGLICYKYAIEHPDHNLKEDISHYGLYITEDDGEIDWAFPCLDPHETISKFEFTTLGLIEMKPSDKARYNTISCIQKKNEEVLDGKDKEQEEVAKDLAKMEGHTTAMEAPLYQSYRVYIINKMRAKTEIHLGISGEKIEIDPVITGKGAARFWNRQRAVSYHIDNIAWCEVTETKGSKTIFTLVYTPQSSAPDNILSHSHSLHQSASFKNHDFEADSVTAEEIVRKINHILELHSSQSRKEYLAQKERKAARRKSFHLHR
ncbi:PREDICTED: stress-activated map kinase-interacting protein 1 [Cyphomyrmex costatus]|uniref:Stress-activated map kinase-interacting protein 1 n=1 Tax=Cyphomyrmex costatus TaxID=456900 RepID=A0A195D2W1_9HYME|nr:PREDICTED: stress-activated map kinase-interacting protein 1 [Cyphomyrmex costatus]XP_018406682.1 PREDICTED: stress-activated map kinase-interacting protein 1 [Cyphomyrmex costatus]KYN06699.1 Stress-activated map kinase-interacting protein 1 [Cyphomyrmex costatus]